MPRGSAPGERRGGRKKGTPNKRTAAMQAEILATGESPLDYMLRVMRDPSADHERRDKMAAAAAPYVHPKLSAIEHAGSKGGAPLRMEIAWKSSPSKSTTSREPSSASTTIGKSAGPAS